MARSIEKSRKIRAMEAKRDKLMETKKKVTEDLKITRVQLANAKKS